ncbi:hypothetical protein WDW86_19885 [Bdellovibrionota bacterium FG-2]
MRVLTVLLAALVYGTLAIGATEKPETFEVDLKFSDGKSVKETKTRLSLEAGRWTSISSKRSGVTTKVSEGNLPTSPCHGDDHVLARYSPRVSPEGKKALHIEFLIINTGSSELIRSSPSVIILPGRTATVEQNLESAEKPSSIMLKVTHSLPPG